MSGRWGEEPRLLGDSGAAVCVCPVNYHEEFGLDSSDEAMRHIPELSMVDSTEILTYGIRRITYAMTEAGFELEVMWIVARVHLPVVAFSYLNDIGFDVLLRAHHQSYFSWPDETDSENVCPIYREGPLFWLQPLRVIHDQEQQLVAGVKDRSGHDEWRLEGMTLVRVHKRAREQLFNPSAQGVGLPEGVILDMIQEARITYATFVDGTSETKRDTWFISEPPTRLRKKWTGETRFALIAPGEETGEDIQEPDYVDDFKDDFFDGIDYTEDDDMQDLPEKSDNYEEDMWNVFDQDLERKEVGPVPKITGNTMRRIRYFSGSILDVERTCLFRRTR